MSPDKERVPPSVYHMLDTENTEIDSKMCRITAELVVTDDFLSADESYRSSKTKYVPQITWPDLIAQIFVHVGCIYGLCLILMDAKFLTILWGTCNSLNSTHLQ